MNFKNLCVCFANFSQRFFIYSLKLFTRGIFCSLYPCLFRFRVLNMNTLYCCIFFLKTEILPAAIALYTPLPENTVIIAPPVSVLYQISSCNFPLLSQLLPLLLWGRLYPLLQWLVPPAACTRKRNASVL